MTSNVRAKPPFRADHVGSLRRPRELAEARKSWHQGALAGDQLEAIEDAAIAEAVALQQDAGLRGISDGEFRRDYWHLDFMWGFEGVEPSEAEFTANFSGGKDFIAPIAQVVGKVGYPKDGIMRRHFSYLNGLTTQTAKFTIPAPTMFRHRSGENVVAKGPYGDIDALWDDLGAAYNEAMLDLYGLGCRYLQLDDVNSAMLCDQGMRERLGQQGEDPERLLDAYIAVNNAAIAGRPDDLAVTTHMCRGNFRSGWIGAGGFEPLRFVPKDKLVVLGLVTSKTAALEPKDELKRRIEEASRYIDIGQLCLSPQCGFSSTHHGNEISIDEQRRKLEHIVAVAEEVWGGV